ncbi:MAG: cell division protein FtsK [Legionellales bacterium]|nr:cell division protein FtsK [Legionellales bacterium]
MNHNPYAKLQMKLKELAMLLFVGFAVFILVALMSYNLNDSQLLWQSQSNQNTGIQNIEGIVGARLADLLFVLFGYAAFTAPFFLILSAWKLWCPAIELSNKHSMHLLLTTLLVLTITACLSCLFSLFCVDDQWLPFGPGGLIGYQLAWFLLEPLNVFGTVTVMVMMIGMSATLILPISLAEVAQQILRVMKWLVESWFSLIETANLPKTVADKKQPDFELNPATRKSNEKKQPISRSRNLAVSENSKHKSRKKLLTLDLLASPKRQHIRQVSQEQLKLLSQQIESHLKDFGIDCQVVSVQPGPVVSRFELDLAAGTKVSKVTALAKDLARSLSVTSVRVVEVIAGKSLIGIELPNEHRQMVQLHEILGSNDFMNTKQVLPLGLGKDIAGRPIIVDLAKMPHLLVAGTTGSGKSVGLNAMLLSLLYQKTPENLKMIMIDPKMLELSVYDGIPHLLTPVVTDMNNAAASLRWCVAEMDRRYQIMAACGVRNISGYNALVKQKSISLSDLGLSQGSLIPSDDEKLQAMPHIVVLADEFADMIMVVGKKVEQLIARLAQKARAAGIHLILATQRPSVDVITGLIKANIPTRISFQVSSKIDSRTILDQQGAEQLLGHGDMLYLPPGLAVPTRVHGAFVDDHEVHAVVTAVKSSGQPSYIDNICSSISLEPAGGSDDDGEKDELYDQAVAIVIETRKSSISYVQRRLKIGYNRAANLIETMEKCGVLGPVTNSGVREILVEKN